ncbi:hypothetical protein IG631_06610 [Alternaria alternata]|nr:hypothetical protein IG631_06610 [Alternaria alternata]
MSTSSIAVPEKCLQFQIPDARGLLPLSFDGFSTLLARSVRAVLYELREQPIGRLIHVPLQIWVPACNTRLCASHNEASDGGTTVERIPLIYDMTQGV